MFEIHTNVFENGNICMVLENRNIRRAFKKFKGLLKTFVRF